MTRRGADEGDVQRLPTSRLDDGALQPDPLDRARGIVIPFVVIYFSQIVATLASIVGAGIAASGLGGIAFVMLVAGQIDRRGGHPVLLMCMSVLALATLGYPWATNVWLFLLVTVVLTFASQLYWPSDATIASITDPSRVAEAMSILRVANAVGIGAGFIGGAGGRRRHG